MDKVQLKKALEKLLESKGTRNFSQTIDLVINLKEMDIKKNDQQVDFFVTLPHSKGKEVKVCGLVGHELFEDAKTHLDCVYEVHDFDRFKNKSNEVKKLANEYDFFVAQANIMAQVATFFGKILGPRGKMPNPKAGCVVPPKAQLGTLKERLTKTVRVTAKTSLSVKTVIGKEDQNMDNIVENGLTIYNQLISHTPQGVNNIKNIMVKLTMSSPVKVK